MRKMEIELEGVKVVAELLEDKAPKTCEAFWKILPLEAEAEHSTMSGTSIWFGHEKLPELPEKENFTAVTSQGDILLKPERKGVILVYGRRSFSQWVFGPQPANCFAIIWDPEQLKKFESVAEKLKIEGRKKIFIRKIE